LLVVEELKRERSNWDSFLLAVGIPKDLKGYFPMPAERIISHRAEDGVGKVVQKGRTLEAPTPQQQYPREGASQGRTRKLGKPES
jgi:hypothetical protein